MGIGILVILLLSAFAVGFWSTNTSENLMKKISVNDSVKGYTPHTPIKIDGNSGFNYSNGVVAGSGHSTDPYIIEGWYIDAQGGTYGIWINYTNAYFIIQNCKIMNAKGSNGTGIYLNTVQNGRITGNNVSNNVYGFYLSSASNNIISQNKIYNSSNNGIYMGASSDNTFYSNKVSWSNGNGFYIYNNSKGNVIENNTIYENVNGIYLYSSPNNNTISGNNISNNSWCGIYLYYSNNNTIRDNTCLSNGGAGVLLWYSNNNSIKNNTCSSNNWAGIGVDNSSNFNVLENNSCPNNRYGIRVHSSHYNRVDNNTCSNNWMYGNLIDSSSNYNVIMYNLIYQNTNDGIYMKNLVEHNTISRNDIYLNDWHGIHLYDADYNTISNNSIHSNYGDGIYLEYNADGNKLFNNTIVNNDYGVYIKSGSYNRFYNNSFWYNHGTGDSYNPSYIQVYNVGTNYWNTSGTPHGYGNYWRDWANNNNTNDQNPHDGIVDWPYVISANVKDYYPLKVAPTPMPPLPPRVLQANAGSKFVNLTWNYPFGNGSSPLIEYRIYKNGSYLGSVPPTQLYYNDTNVSNGITYTYYLTAMNSAGESDKSNDVYATPEGVPSVPLNFSAVAGNKYVNLTWLPPNDDGGKPITGYKLYRGTSAGGEVLIATPGPTQTYYNDTFVTNGVTYYYYITAVNDNGEGQKSPELNATPLGPPTAPENLTATTGNGYVNLTWNSSNNNGGSEITEYRIYRNGTLIANVSGNQLYYNDTNVVNGQTYTYYVTAANSVGESDKSNEVQVTPGSEIPEFSTGIWMAFLILISLLGVVRFRKS